MAKLNTLFNCSMCGYRPPKWVGCCPECSAFGSISQLEEKYTTSHSAKKNHTAAPLTPMTTIALSYEKRIVSGITEWDRVTGGGIMHGSFMILTGDPGIGKSTLLLQLAYRIAQTRRVFYFSSEESLSQIRHRAERLGCVHENLLCSEESRIEAIIDICVQEKPDLIIVDSVQNCYSEQNQVLPGSIGQLREVGFHLMKLAKENGIAVLLTGHITKEGTIAGPKMLEHLVDTVLYLQGEDRWQTRMLRSVKNRFGALGELGFFSMEEEGLKEIPDINTYLLKEASFSPGSVLISSLEGSRPVLLELQALLVATKYGIPQRVISGVDQKQVVLIAAILEKYLRIRLSDHDLFFKVGGGFKIKESNADLGIALSLLSTYFQESLPEKTIALGEISLTGQIKPINQINMHIKEAEKFGFTHIIIAHTQQIPQTALKVIRSKSVYDLLTLFNNAV